MIKHHISDVRVNFNALCLCFCVISVFSLPVRVAWSLPLAALSPQVAPSATESCFARQHNVSDNNNQCFSGANGHLPSQLAAQRPGAIDNQPLVNTDPMKARMCACVIAARFILFMSSTKSVDVCESADKSRPSSFI